MESSPSTYLGDMFGLEGQTAMVTGASKGIGRGIAIALASAGAKEILLVARDPTSPDILETRSAIHSLPHKPACEILTCDLNDRLSVTNFVDSNFEKPNRAPVDILVNCGGIQHRCPAEDFPITEWDNIINVNLTSGFLLSQKMCKLWLETSLNPKHVSYTPNRRKKIVFVASVTSFIGSVEIPAYVASKGAIMQLTKALNNEWMSKGVNVNAIAPGYINTGLTKGITGDKEKERLILDRVPIKRWGLPEDLAGAVIYLSSRASDFVGGEIHCVDGGFMGR